MARKPVDDFWDQFDPRNAAKAVKEAPYVPPRSSRPMPSVEYNPSKDSAAMALAADEFHQALHDAFQNCYLTTPEYRKMCASAQMMRDCAIRLAEKEHKAKERALGLRPVGRRSRKSVIKAVQKLP